MPNGNYCYNEFPAQVFWAGFLLRASDMTRRPIRPWKQDGQELLFHQEPFLRYKPPVDDNTQRVFMSGSVVVGPLIAESDLLKRNPSVVLRIARRERQEMTTSESWRSLFENWPESIPRQGLVVTSFGESIPFSDFMLSGGILLLERDKPDSSGARKVMLSYDAVSAIKLTHTIELARFQVMGFQPPF